MRLAYYERWHRHYGEPAGLITADEAQRRHKIGEPYVVVIGRMEAPECMIEVNRQFFGVSFFDERKREYLLYNFEQIDGERLFLKEAIHREYTADKERPAAASAYRFTPDGAVSIETSSGSFRQVEVSDGVTDVSGNWEAVPTFGDYDRLLRKHRSPDESKGDPSPAAR